MQKFWKNLKSGLAAIVAAAWLSSKAETAPDNPPAQVRTHETYQYILRMDSGDEFFVSSANGMLTIHDSAGTGRGWIEGRHAMLNTTHYQLDRPPEDGLRCADCVDDAHPEHWELFEPRQLVSGTTLEGMLTLNTELRHPNDQTAPQFCIENESDLDGNSFLHNAYLSISIQSEPGTIFLLRDNNCFQGAYLARTHTLFLPVRLNSQGNHSVEITAIVVAGNTSAQVMSIGIGDSRFTVNGIDFITCGRAYEQYSRDASLYGHLAGVIHGMNINLRNRNQHVRRINIPYLSVVQFAAPNTPLIIDHNGTRDGCHLGQDLIYIGHGNFNQYNDEGRRLRDVYTHEFAHHVFDSLTENDRMVFNRIYKDIRSSSLPVSAPLFNRLFCDGSYEERADVGHPWDNAHELFASAYHITMNYWNELFSALSTQDPKVQWYARRVIDFVVRHQAH